MQPDLDFMHELADAAAAETLPRFRSGTAVVNKEEGGFDPVTEADRAAEAAIRDLIRRRFPDHGIMGEEYGSEALDAEFVWVIDPIDGTRAFISGLPVWGTLIGLYRNGRSFLGLMDQPFTGERYLADRDGAHYRGPGRQGRIKSRPCTGLSDATLFTTSPHLFSGGEERAYRAVEERVNQDFPMLDSVPSTTGTLAVFSQQTLFWRIVRRDIKPHIVEMRRQPS